MTGNAKGRGNLSPVLRGWGTLIAAVFSLFMASLACYELFISVTGVHYPKIRHTVKGSFAVRFDVPTVGWSVILVMSLLCIAFCIILLTWLRRSRQSAPAWIRLAVLTLLVMQGIICLIIAGNAFSVIGNFG